MSDLDARRAAVEVHRSVIVQAPAGSGKTTLLVERFLGLLATVEQPEEILAITFTRKAANEMRERVLRYLQPDFHTDSPHEAGASAKAKAIAGKVEAWQLLDNPGRLMIRTIDSFNHFLASAMPIATALGPVPSPAENPKRLYRAAARTVLGQLEGNDPLRDDIACLLAWRDHRSQDIENILTNLLAQRDQWIRALGSSQSPAREHLEGVLFDLVQEQMMGACNATIKALRTTQEGASGLCELLRYAGSNLDNDLLRNLDTLPALLPDDLEKWQAIANFLLTTSGKLRAKVTKANGFDKPDSAKSRMTSLLAELTEQPQCVAGLVTLTALPMPAYADDEWQVLDALVRVLQRAAVQLQLVFATGRQIDYAGLAGAALDALGDEETGYTDLGLYLDNRIKHLLVDEFQDTNWNQLYLLEKLMAGWQNGDGRTLFLVGDPMQSIYRFREAEVGLFMRSRDQGIGQVELEPLQLTQNFRAKEELVDWVNRYIGPTFPAAERIADGAVTFVASEAGRDRGGDVRVLGFADEANEAVALVEFISQALSEHAQDETFSAAIIVRGRAHLRAILPELNRRGVPFRAVKLDPALSKSVVQDLLALTQAVTQPANVTARLAVLRAPMCGLTLDQLQALGGDGATLTADDALLRLDEDGQQRAARVYDALAAATVQSGRAPLRTLVEGIWTRLGADLCCISTQADMRDAQIFLDALEQATPHGHIQDWNDFVELLDGLFTEGDAPSPDVKLEILTMHAAKGLEWDLVILPSLHRHPPPESSTLLNWLPFVDTSGQEHILMAPLRSAQTSKDTQLIKMIRNQRRIRTGLEHQRLLYVAATRARQCLVLCACLDTNKSDIKPAAGSLLADLWLTCEDAFIEALDEHLKTVGADTPASKEDFLPPNQSLLRVPENWQPPIPNGFSWRAPTPVAEQDLEVEYSWVSAQARRTGTIVHRLLEHVGRIGVEALTDAMREQMLAAVPDLTRSMGGSAQEVDEATHIIRQAFENTLTSTNGRWILSNAHQAGACELAISGTIDGQWVSAIVDRTFIDEKGVRWIIDYKSGYHAGADLEVFLQAETDRYRSQLSRYQEIFQQLEDRTIKTALYLPRHDALLELTPA